MKPPEYLALFDITPDNVFEPEELLYRRHPCGVPKIPKEYFSGMSWELIKKGISVNRSKYSHEISDVLWLGSESGGICIFELKKERVISIEASFFPTNDIKTGAKFILTHKPGNCNYAHCDIDVTEIVEKPARSIQKDIKAFLSSFFNETEINNC
jgi:hypothetical protein